ncbi:hypothetical protein FNV43_RR19534 [Rhamnella rubrinervis]|uniref:Galactinol--sucrose galactosyltransferase n=1 Tax=Rhamnella rubrinervis TaxID=2594499 RepID=A0A8K0GTD6_9ROSA|nr:hypothetical protein FNV43_RR19534 [Rhamnella rubrinervis]
MVITGTPSIKDGCLVVRSNVVLTGVPENVVVSPASYGSAFIGVTSTSPSSRLVFSLGILGAFKFLSLFKFKIWWMIPRRTIGSEIPMETQMLLLEAKEESPCMMIFLLTNLLKTPFTFSSYCVRWIVPLKFARDLDASVQTSQALEALFVSSGTIHLNSLKSPSNPISFRLVWMVHLGRYTKVHPQGIEEGLKSFNEGGCSPKFLIIDDGWQHTTNEFCKEGEPHIEGTQFATRLVDIKENGKFKSSGSEMDAPTSMSLSVSSKRNMD